MTIICVIDKILTNLLPAGLMDFCQVLNISEAITVNKLLKCSLDRIVHCVEIWAIAILQPIFWFRKSWNMTMQPETQLFVVIDKLAHQLADR